MKMEILARRQRPSLNGLKRPHEPSIDKIFHEERRSPTEGQPPFVEHTGAISQIENQEIIASRIERLQIVSLESGFQVVIEHRILANRVNPYLVHGAIFEIDAVPAAEDVRVVGCYQTSRRQSRSRTLPAPASVRPQRVQVSLRRSVPPEGTRDVLRRALTCGAQRFGIVE